MRLVEVRVERDERLAVPTSIPPWELPILEAIHGAEKVVEIRRWSDGRRYPSPQGEYERLVKRYGVHVESDTAWAIRVYGEGQKAVRDLASAMKDAAIEEVEDFDDQPAVANG